MSFKDYLKEALDVSNTDAYVTNIDEIEEGQPVESFGRGFGHIKSIWNNYVTVEFTNGEEEYVIDDFANLIRNGKLRVHRE